MYIDYDLLEEMYDETPQVQVIRRTKMTEEPVGKKKTKDYSDVRKNKYGEN